MTGVQPHELTVYFFLFSDFLDSNKYVYFISKVLIINSDWITELKSFICSEQINSLS